MSRIGVLVLGAATAALTAAVALAAQSPRQLRAAMLAAASARHSVHYVSTTTAPGRTIRIVGDVGPKLGSQRITLKLGGRSGNAAVLVVGGSAYIQGNAFTLQKFFPFTKAQATKYAGQWISIPSTSGAYSAVSADTTFASFLADLLPGTHLSSVHGNVAGKAAVGIRGVVRQAGTKLLETVYAPASGTPLPFAEKAVVTGSKGAGNTQISRWNEAVHVTAPANSVPITTVVGH
jgi:hypothetical protein